MYITLYLGEGGVPGRGPAEQPAGAGGGLGPFPSPPREYTAQVSPDLIKKTDPDLTLIYRNSREIWGVFL